MDDIVIKVLYLFIDSKYGFKHVELFRKNLFLN